MKVVVSLSVAQGTFSWSSSNIGLDRWTAIRNDIYICVNDRYNDF